MERHERYWKIEGYFYESYDPTIEDSYMTSVDVHGKTQRIELIDPSLLRLPVLRPDGKLQVSESIVGSASPAKAG